MKVALTDVTYMKDGHVCIAGWDVDAEKMVRPLPTGTGHYEWTEDQAKKGNLLTGSVVEFSPTGQAGTGQYPHLTEDVMVAGRFNVVDTLGGIRLALRCNGSVSDDVDAVFSHQLNKGKYVLPETRCASLGAVVTHPRRIGFSERTAESGNKLRCWFYVGTGDAEKKYELPVSSVILRDLWEKSGIDALNDHVHGHTKAHIRVGLARPWPVDGENRCYAMVNNIILY